jgi:large subunit ribosomal protein L18
VLFRSLALLRSGKLRLAVRKSNCGFRLQIIEFHETGDRTLAEVTSSMLKKYGWKAHCGSIPAAYLSGMLMGKLAQKKNISEVVPDLGMHMSIKGSALYACLAGAKDAGLRLNIGKDALPRKERLEGKHIAEHAKLLKSKDNAKYAKHFSAYLKNSIQPENLPEHFLEVKKEIEKEV